MPTYEFRCPKGHEFERFYKTMSTAPSEVHCPECGALAVRQLSGGGGLVFKGSGFYLTDYGKNAHRKPTEGEKAEKAERTEGSKAEGSKAQGEKAQGSKAESSKSESSPAKAESREPKAESREPKAESREPKAERREHPPATSRGHPAESPKPKKE
jgi:putative FmdB family regulatory protein